MPRCERGVRTMTRRRVIALTLLAMIAFAGNSLLCRLALKHTGIDAASFTSIRILSGAIALWVIARARGGARAPAGNWPSALALFAYAAGFSFAYVSLPASAGALLLFGAVQATMIGYGLLIGERLRGRQIAGLLCAFAGLAALFLPGLTAPSVLGSLVMLGAGVAWGVFLARQRRWRSHRGDRRELPSRSRVRGRAERGDAPDPVVGWPRRRVRGRVRGDNVGRGVRAVVHGLARIERDQRGHGAAQRAGHRSRGRRCLAERGPLAAVAARVGSRARRRGRGHLRQTATLTYARVHPR